MAVVYRRSPRSPGGDRRWGLVGLASCMFVFWLWLSTKSFFGGSPQSGWTESLPILLPLFVFGAALTITRAWWWVLLAAPVLWTVWWVSTVELLPVDMGVLLRALPAALFATCLGASWKTIGVGLDWIASRERLNLLLVNVLNIADALMTEFFVHRGLAVETNPLVRVIGLPLKIVFVLAASVLLYRIRPKMLVWPTIFLAAVLAWHMSGLWLNVALLGSP
jgi:hypothetical protein